MHPHYNKLLSKLSVGRRELKNRIIFGSHPTNFGFQNRLSNRHAAYYEARARGGAGLIVLEELVVHPSDLPYEKAICAFAEHAALGMRQVAERAHAHGATVVAQLNHSGLQSEGSTAMRELWGPSAVPDVVSREVPKAMEEQDIQEIIRSFAQAAGLAVKCGLDGVEVNAAQFSLIRQFLSPLTNMRSDRYGGTFANRFRLLLEVLQAVRAAIGEAAILGLKLCGDEFAPWGGLSPDDILTAAGELTKQELLNYLIVSVGSMFTLHLSPATHYSEPGLALGIAARLKNACNIPVFAEGRLHSADYAARVVNEGLVDGVCMNRALICDPQLPAKLYSGREDSILECLSCNQGCQVRRSMGKPLSCMLNPAAGAEDENNVCTVKAACRKKVLIIGGGPGGLAAARAAAVRGHRVILWDEGRELGGKLLLNTVPGYTGALACWLRELSSLGVTVVKQKRAEVEAILAEEADAVILATGSKTVEPQGWGPNRIISALAAVERPPEPGLRILVWDEVGDQLMARAVEGLAAAGNTLYLVSPDYFAGYKLAGTSELSSWNQRVMGSGTEIFTTSRIKEVRQNCAVVENIFGGEPVTITGIDLFVHNKWPKPNDELYWCVKDQVKHVIRVGDCLAPRGIGAALREGQLAASGI